MFGKKKDEAVVETMAPVTTKQTVIEAGTYFKGNFKTETPIIIKGTLEGNIESTSDVIVAEAGYFKGKGVMQSIDVAGTVDGDVKCYEMASISATGKVSGSLATVRLLTDDGSTFDGKLVMIQASKISEEEVE